MIYQMLPPTEEHVPYSVRKVRSLTIAVEADFRIRPTEAYGENLSFRLTFLNISSHERAIG
jgi:hypothetical protein